MTRRPQWLPGGAHGRDGTGAVGAPRVLFVCTGNICRSALAACYFGARRQTAGAAVSSAGTHAVVGRAMDGPMADLARALGLDPSRHRSRQVTGRILNESDIVFTFGPEHYEWILANHPDATDRVLELGRVGHALAPLSRHRYLPWDALPGLVRERRPAETAEDWIEDPYGRGADVYGVVMRKITGSIDLLAARVTWRAEPGRGGRRRRAGSPAPPAVPLRVARGPDRAERSRPGARRT